jgi:hypothetical protein
MGDVVELHTETTLDIPVEGVLNGALDAGLEHVVVVGRNEDGSLYAASSIGSSAETVWLLEAAKRLIFGLAGE